MAIIQDFFLAVCESFPISLLSICCQQPHNHLVYLSMSFSFCILFAKHRTHLGDNFIIQPAENYPYIFSKESLFAK